MRGFVRPTQVAAKRKLVDLQILALDATGRVTSRLWGEHKVGAQFGSGQVANYVERLGDESAGRSALMIVVPSERLHRLRLQEQILDAAVPVHWLTWQDIAAAISAVGQRRGGRTWRIDAPQPEAPAEQRLIAELLSTLERKDLAHMDPLSLTDVFALANAADARQNLAALFDRIPQHFRNLAQTDNRNRRMPDFDSWYHVLDAGGSWPTERYQGWPEFYTRDGDEWRPEANAMDMPCFAAGYSFELEHGAALLGDELDGWRASLEGAGVDVVQEGDFVRCTSPRYLNDIVTVGVALDDQAKALAGWIEETIAVIDSRLPEVT
jgi:hypothetical protein